MTSRSNPDSPARLVGDGIAVPCADGQQRPYVNLDVAASANAHPDVAAAVEAFVPWYSSVHRGAGFTSREATRRFESARERALAFAGAGRAERGDVAIFVRNTTEAVNHLAYRLRIEPGETVVTTVVEHHANLLPWTRACQPRFVECAPDGTFTPDDVAAVLDAGPRPRLLALTGASNVSGWMPDLDAITDIAHARGVPVFVDAAQLAPHRPIPEHVDFVAWSGHKMYAPYGAGVLVGPRHAFEEGDPFLVGGGAVDLVELGSVDWTSPPDREEAGSPNVIGAIALAAGVEVLERIGWPTIVEHDDALATKLRDGLAAIDGVRLLGPAHGTLPLATFTVAGVHHSLVAARLSAEYAIGVRHGCFCAHPYLLRLLGLNDDEVHEYRAAVLRGDRRAIPGAVRASAGISTTGEELDRLISAVAHIASGAPAPFVYEQDDTTGDYWPVTDAPGWQTHERGPGASCARG